LFKYFIYTNISLLLYFSEVKIVEVIGIRTYHRYSIWIQK